MQFCPSKNRTALETSSFQAEKMTSPIRKHIGARIKSHRKGKRVTQAALAEILDCEVTTLGRYERGEFAPDGEQLVKMAAFFNISPLDFFPGEKDIQWQVVVDLRSALIDLVYSIDNPTNLEKLIAEARLLSKS